MLAGARLLTSTCKKCFLINIVTFTIERGRFCRIDFRLVVMVTLYGGITGWELALDFYIYNPF